MVAKNDRIVYLVTEVWGVYANDYSCIRAVINGSFGRLSLY